MVWGAARSPQTRTDDACRACRQSRALFLSRSSTLPLATLSRRCCLFHRRLRSSAWASLSKLCSPSIFQDQYVFYLLLWFIIIAYTGNGDSISRSARNIDSCHSRSPYYRLLGRHLHHRHQDNNRRHVIIPHRSCHDVELDSSGGNARDIGCVVVSRSIQSSSNSPHAQWIP